MIVSRIRLRNWRNFREVDTDLSDRAFLLGPNASGKSNFLDVFRFLRDIVRAGGGLQRAVSSRGGLSKIRCLAARKEPTVEIRVELSNGPAEPAEWVYEIGIRQEPRGYRHPYLTYERAWHKEQQVLSRPDDTDERDQLRLTQTHLEQINANEGFRPVAEFFQAVLYLHLLPQLFRYPEQFQGPGPTDDPFGRKLLERITKTPKKTRNARLRKIENALRSAVPQLRNLTHMKDDMGFPHLEATYDHWRSHDAKQREDQFSDGTLRLIALLWVLLDGDSLLLLEEPELYLHSGIVSKLPSIIHKIQGKRSRQVLISTHSTDLLSDPGIGGEEALMLIPGPEGTKLQPSSGDPNIRKLLQSGLTIAETALSRTRPENLQQLNFFE